MAHEVFISHSSSDKPVADAVCAALERIRIRCWMAPRDVQPGRSFAGEITRAIQHSKVLVLIFSAHSNTSEQVLREVQLAANSHLHIVQFRIQDVLPNEDLEYYLSAPHWLDALSPPLEKNLQRLGASIKALLQMSGEDASKRASTVDSGIQTSESDHFPAATAASIAPTPTQTPALFVTRLAPMFRTAASKAGTIWQRNSRPLIIGAGAALLIFFASIVLVVMSHWSRNSSAEKDYAEAVRLAAGLSGETINTPKAAELLQRAAERNFPEAEARLAYWVNDGSGGLAKDSVKAEQWAKRALADGLTNKAKDSADAQVELAVLYVRGLGVIRDEAK